MKEFCSVTVEELKAWLVQHEEKEYHAQQIFEWVYQKSVLDWDLMSNLSKDLRLKLKEAYSIPCLQAIKITDSDDQETYKFLWRLHDQTLVESVLICSGDRRTVCVSSQVGCPARCAFCASGKKGFFRNLKPAEIVEQVVQINHWLARKGERVSHVVYMGMGEPMKNYEFVLRSIRQICDPALLNISQRRITVSTVGVVEGIRRLAGEGMKVNLVLSLHAPNQHIRQKIIPYARQYPLETIMEVMDHYAEKTKRDITFEYTMIAGINDHPDHAHELGKLLRGKQATINLIPLNPIPGIKLFRPSKQAIKQFRSVLFGHRIANTCRYTKGDDIAAACGQLALQELENTETNAIRSDPS